MKFTGLVALLLLCRSLVAVEPGVVAADGQSLFRTELLANGDAESGPGGDGSALVPVPGWTTTGLFTVTAWDTPGGFPLAADSRIGGGLNLFTGGRDGVMNTAFQSIELNPAAAEIDEGGVTAVLSGWLGGFASQSDRARLGVTFRDNNGNQLGQMDLPAVSAADRGNQTVLVFRTISGLVPQGTRRADVVLEMIRNEGTFNDGYADNLSFVLYQEGRADPNCLPLPGGATHWWRGDSGLADVIRGTPAILRNGAGFGPGVVGDGYVFDGVNDFIEVPDAPNFGRRDFTVECWVRFNALAGEQVILEKYIETLHPNRAGWTLTKLVDNRFLLDQSGENSGIIFGNAVVGAWQHIAVTRAGTRMVAYVNGLWAAEGFSGADLDSSASLKFGHRGHPGDTFGSMDLRGFYLNGGLDEVTLYKRALSAAEIAQIYNSSVFGKCDPSAGIPFRWFGGTGNWSNPANWSPNGLPGSNDSVIVPSGTVIVDTNPTIANLTVDGVLLGIPGNANGLQIQVSDTLMVGPAGKIDVSSSGLRGGNRAGNNVTFAGFDGTNYFYGEGYDANNNPAPLLTGSASHGTLGENISPNGTPPQPLYDSKIAPRLLGSGGYAAVLVPPGLGGNGGGLIRLTVGDLILDGALLADGGDANGPAAGGSGGSIHLQVIGGVLSGNGRISARGGKGNPGFPSAGDGIIAVSGFSENSFRGIIAAGAETQLGAPQIVSQPADQTVPLGAAAILSVQVMGAPPFQYQWRLNGMQLAGATNDTYFIGNFQLTNAGSYSVTVQNFAGTVSSREAMVAPNLAALPAVNVFRDRGLIADPTGIGLASNRAADLEPGEPRHAGKPTGKSVWLSWTAAGTGIATFSTVGSSFDTVLAIYTGAQVSALQPVASNDDGGAAGFSSAVSFNAVAGQAYAIAVAGIGDASGNIILSWDLQITAQKVPVILQQPASVSATPGSDVLFRVVVEPVPELTYQWFFEDILILGQNSDSLLVPRVDRTGVAAWRVEVATPAGRVISEPAFLELGDQPGAFSEDKFEAIFLGEVGQPALQNGSTRRKAAFASVAVGSIGSQTMENIGATTQQGEPSHGGVIGGSSRWFGLKAVEDGVMLVDTIGSEFDTVLAVYRGTNLLNLTLIASDNNGAPDGRRSSLKFAAARNVNYSVAVDGVRGAQGKIKLNWMLGTRPVLGQSLSNQIVNEGGNLTLAVSGAAATPPASYQWEFNGRPLAGATGPTLQLNDLRLANAGTYRVRIENFAGTVTSTAHVTVFPAISSPLRLSGPIFAGQNLILEIVGPAGRALALQSSTDLVRWEDLSTNALGAGLLRLNPGSGLAAPRQFFRARLLP